jgi:Holliday junction DNA helicase RuvA
MIASLRGRVQDFYHDSLVVDVGGVGFNIFTTTAILDRVNLGEEVLLHTYLSVREDSLALYGFETKDERELFTLLITVNGVGPRLALAVLSALSTEEIRRAILHEQPDVFSRVSGIGRKTAQKILLQLHDRIPEMEGYEKISKISDVDTEVLEALTNLGYSVVEAQTAIQSIPHDTPEDVETRLRIAFQYFI